MLLKRDGVQYCRIIREGNEILRVRYAAAGGDSAAATHTAALIEELLSYAEGSLAERLATERTGACGAFPHRYEIDWREEAEAWGCTVTLTTALYRGRELLEARTLVTYWDGDGACQCKPPKRRRQRRPTKG